MSTEWFAGELGPLTGAQLKTLAATGRIDESTPVRRNGCPPRPARDVKGLAFAVPAPPPVMVPPVIQEVAAKPTTYTIRVDHRMSSFRAIDFGFCFGLGLALAVFVVTVLTVLFLLAVGMAPG